MFFSFSNKIFIRIKIFNKMKELVFDGNLEENN